MRIGLLRGSGFGKEARSRALPADVHETECHCTAPTALRSTDMDSAWQMASQLLAEIAATWRGCLTNWVSLLLLALTSILAWRIIGRRGATGVKGRGSRGPQGLWQQWRLLRALLDGNIRALADEWTQDYGDLFTTSFLGRKFVFVSTAELGRRLFHEDPYRKFSNDRQPSFVGEFVFHRRSIVGSFDNAVLTQQRKLFHSAARLYGEGVAEFEDTVLDAIKDVMDDVTEEDVKAGRDVSVNRLVSRFVTTTLHVLLKGEQPSRDEPVVAAMLEYVTWLNKLFYFALDFPLSLCPTLRFLPFSRFRCVWSHVSEQQSLVLDNYFRQTKEQLQATREGPGLVRALLCRQQQLGEDVVSDLDIQCLLSDIIPAGYLSTYGVLCGWMALMSRHPEVQTRLQEEVDATLIGAPVSLATRQDMPYAHAVAMETMRILSHASFIIHSAKDDFEFEGVAIPRHATIVWNLWTWSHNPTVWGDPENFRPERFLDQHGELVSHEHPLRKGFLLFGIGRRQCPGETLAKTRMFLFMVSMLRRFNIRPPQRGPPPETNTRLWVQGAILQPHQYNVRLEMR